MVAILCLISTFAKTQTASDNSLLSGNAPLDLGSFTTNEFLPVKEAYQPDAWFEGDNLVIQWNIAPEYYLYRNRTFFAGDSQYAEPQFAEGLLIHDEFFDKQMVVYRGSTEMRLPQYSGKGILTIEAQGCADAGLCYPPTDFWFDIDPQAKAAVYSENMPASLSTLSLSEPDSNSSQTNITGDKFTEGQVSSLLLALLFAFAGGLILNLMPCVFPILAIKALKISTASESFALRAKEAGAYTAGILTTVLVIAGILITVRAGGSQVGWGFQLQSPAVILALTILFFVIGLSFSGLIEFGARFAGIGQNLTQEGKPLKSFFTGALAMIVASPCSAPFMAAALGYAISQPTAISLLVFTSLGLGMAAPLILLYLVPAFAAILPKPGAWMETLKQFLAFPMYLTCIWLIWVLIAQIGATGAALTMASLCLLTMAIWLYGKSGTALARAASAISLVVAALLAFGSLQQVASKPSISAFSLTELDRQVGGDQPVFLDVTADWCITCKFNESRVLYSAEIEQLFEQQNVIYLVADWTNENPEITKLLDRYQRVGIPLYLYFAPNQSTPIVLPQVLTKEMMKELFI